MAIKIEKKITRYAVQKPEERRPDESTKQAETKAAALALSSKPVERIVTERAEKKHKAEVIRMHEALERPELLIGSTYKVKTPVSDHAMYITINDIVLNEGTPYEQRRPFEIFINSKNLDHFQWIVALTRIISAVFRKGGDVAFLVEEMQAVFDPRGGYWKPGGKFMPSLIAEIGDVIEKHLVSIGLMHREGLDEHQKKLIAQKRAEFEAAAKQTDAFAESKFPAGAQLCQKCSTAAVVMMDGCMTCLNCGDSKCG
ncbi:MAG TPA: NrdJb [Gammaproteobacteria bacterium]|jgi:hypothetical protein